MKSTNIPTQIGKIAFDHDMLARDVARELRDPDEIALSHEIAAPALNKLMNMPEFAAKVAELRRQWLDPENTPERIRCKVDLMIEELLPHMWRRMTDPHAPSTMITEIGKLLRSLSTMAKAEEAGVTGSGFHLQINIGDRERIVVDSSRSPGNVFDHAESTDERGA